MGKFLLIMAIIGAIGYGISKFADSEDMQRSVLGTISQEKTIQSVNNSRDGNKNSVNNVVNSNY